MASCPAFTTDDMEVLEFRNAPFGMLVTYSEHWYREHGQRKPRTPRIGVMTDRKFHEDGKGRIICWPEIWWEGEVMARSVHPINLKPYRKKQTLPTRMMDDGQPAT